jgi:hypothetical protein
MLPEFKPFVIRITLLSIIVLAIGYAVFASLPAHFRTPTLPFLVAFFYSLNLVVYYILLTATKKKFSRFVNYFLVGTFLKLLVYIIVMFAYVLYKRVGIVPFLITYLALYIIFTFFEVSSLMNQSGKGHA